MTVSRVTYTLHLRVVYTPVKQVIAHIAQSDIYAKSEVQLNSHSHVTYATR